MPRKHYTRRQREPLQRLAAGERSNTPAWLTPYLADPEAQQRLTHALLTHTQARYQHGDEPHLHLDPNLLPPLG